MEGAGVHLHRVFGFGDTSQTDPFLMMDDFRNDDPSRYAKGFPWHPHRGIETITYVLAGSVEHADSLGNAGVLGPGSVQWMTAGSGILHQEMPHGDDAGRMHGFQLWANLPSSLKMTSPRYQDIAGKDITEVIDDDGTVIRIVVGSWRGMQGPVDGIAADPQYLDVSVPANTRKAIPIDAYRNAFAYVFQGHASFRHASRPIGVQVEKELNGEELYLRDRTGNRTLVLFDSGDEVVVETRDESVRFLLISGKALKEPVAWHGPIVMNTQDEIRQALRDLNDGSFIRESAGDRH
jgi:redox-sensitive bicupin YhaK (pirin superfamily)